MLLCAEPWPSFRSAWLLTREWLSVSFEPKAAFCCAFAPCMFGSTNAAVSSISHSSINDLQGRGGASNVCTGCLLCFLNGTLPFLANCLFPLKPLARMAWFLETVLLPRQLLLASLMHLSRKHLTSDEGYAVGSCLVKRQLQNGAAPVPSLTESMRYGQCSGGAYCL